MKLDLGSFAFGSDLQVGGGNPSWGTALGQGKGLKFTTPGWENILAGMLYKAIPTNKVYMPIGKGGHVYSGLEDDGFQLAALFDQVYINEVRVNAPFIMVIYRDSSVSWDGRRTLKYGDKIEYQLNDNTRIKNTDFIAAAREALQLNEEADWVVSDIYVENQETLHMFAGIVNPHRSTTYANTSERKAAWIESINHTVSESSVYKKYLAGEEVVTPKDDTQDSLQKIFYGAPGTGKSHEVKKQTGELLDNGEERDLPNVFRTTFHPDTDYASFVGCYKPAMESKEPIYTPAQLIDKLSIIKNSGASYPCQKFGAKYWESLKELSANDIKQILTACGFTDSMSVEVPKGIAIGEEFASLNSNKQIVYRFVPQVFTDAYVYAYKNKTEQTYLVIEEINRGNCAQIFGDLFQLLDRKNNISEYSIKADKDLVQYLREQLGADSEGIKDGKLCLPANLNILATMNTSDQSLFPMDSAFKRRWEWEYVPINYKEPKSSTFDICIGKEKEQKTYSWIVFIEKVNEKIFDLTQSEDKQLGNFFIKNSVDEKEFKSKVMFYLWYEVLRDETENNKYFFKKTDIDTKEELGKFIFKDLYEEDATLALQQFMEYLGVAPK